MTQNLYPARRRTELLELLRDRGQASISEVAAAFGVSDDTVRRDVEALAAEGKVERTHGGVTLLPAGALMNASIPFTRRLDVNTGAKDAIARAAAALVEEGQSVIINGGSTTLALAKHLGPKHGLTVVTNNLALPQELHTHGAREIYVLGGTYRLRSQVTIGPVALADGSGKARSIHTDWALIGVGAVSDDGTVWTSSLPEATMMRSMMDCASKTLILADSTKFGHREFAEVADLSDRTTLITDRTPSKALLEQAAEAGAEVIVADQATSEGPA